MRALGLRAEKDRVHWAIVEGATDSPSLVAHDKVSAPATYSEPQALRWYASQLHQLMLEYKPNVIAVRLSETFLQSKPAPTALQSMFERARIEGVMLQTAAAQGVSVVAGPMAMMRSKLGTKSA